MVGLVRPWNIEVLRGEEGGRAQDGDGGDEDNGGDPDKKAASAVSLDSATLCNREERKVTTLGMTCGW